MGTLLPELVTSVVAAKKGQNGMAAGNIIGSNIFNILLILGVSAFIHPIPVITESLYDTVILIGLSIIIYIFAATGDKIERKEGIAMIGAYCWCSRKSVDWCVYFVYDLCSFARYGVDIKKKVCYNACLRELGNTKNSAQNQTVFG